MLPGTSNCSSSLVCDDDDQVSTKQQTQCVNKGHQMRWLGIRDVFNENPQWLFVQTKKTPLVTLISGDYGQNHSSLHDKTCESLDPGVPHHENKCRPGSRAKPLWRGAWWSKLLWHRAAAIRRSVICLFVESAVIVHLRFELADWFPVLPDKLKRHSCLIVSLLGRGSRKIPCKRRCTTWGRDKKPQGFTLLANPRQSQTDAEFARELISFVFLFFFKVSNSSLPPQTWSVVLIIRNQDIIWQCCTPSMQIMLSG